MKKLLTIIGLLALNFSNAQYFQQRFNLDFVTPALRSELNNSGIRTRDNFIAGNPMLFYYAGIGTSYNNTALPAPDNVADRMRFQQLDYTGGLVKTNKSYQFADAAGTPWFHAYGNGIAEVLNTTNSGGYVTVGSVANNTITGAATIAGNSDALFTQLNASGGVVSAMRYDINGGEDQAWCIRKSITVVNMKPTWIICGQSKKSNKNTDCFVARVLVDGTPVWFNRYNFDPTGGQFNSAHNIAKQLCEDVAGNIYAVGTLQDGVAGASIGALAFKLTPAGAVTWANNYGIASDDEFEAVRITADGNLIIGGFTNAGVAAPVTHNMLITKLTSAGGGIMFQHILRAAIGGNSYTSKCYDIIQTINAGVPHYFLAGYLKRGGLNYEMMYKTDIAGAGINWYQYNRMNYTTGFGLDDVSFNGLSTVAYFSSITNPTNIGVSDAHIMKTDYSGRTCGFCTAKPPAFVAIQMEIHQRNWLQVPTGLVTNLVSAVFKYANTLICTQAVLCGDAPAPFSAKGTVVTDVTAKAATLSVFPNPVFNILHLQFNALPAGDYQVSLSNMEGRIVLQKNNVYNNGKSFAEVNISSVASGVYLLTVKKGSLVLKQKVVKQ